jgi:hypothetical protein
MWELGLRCPYHGPILKMHNTCMENDKKAEATVQKTILFSQEPSLFPRLTSQGGLLGKNCVCSELLQDLPPEIACLHETGREWPNQHQGEIPWLKQMHNGCIEIQNHPVIDVLK